MVLPVSSCVVQLICFVYFYIWKNYILIFFFDISSMGTAKLNLKPKQHNSKILHCLAGLHFFEVTICRYQVHTEALRLPFVLSSHSDTQKYLPGTGFQKPFISTFFSKQCCRYIQQHVRGRSLAAPGPLGLYPAAVLESDWTDHPPPSGWSFQNGEGSGVSGGQDASAPQSRSQTERCSSHGCYWVMKKILKSCWCI